MARSVLPIMGNFPAQYGHPTPEARLPITASQVCPDLHFHDILFPDPKVNSFGFQPKASEASSGCVSDNGGLSGIVHSGCEACLL